MREYELKPEDFQSDIAKRLYAAMKPGIEAASVLQKPIVPTAVPPVTVSEPAVRVPVVDKEGYVLLDSIAEQISITEPKLDVKKPEAL